MNFALIVDSCKVGSYTVRDGKAYKFKQPDTPFEFHHSISNECFMGFWSYPFVFEGCFLNWNEWNELPDLELDVIIVVIEKRFGDCTIDKLRKKYPNAKIFGYLREMWNWEYSWKQRIDVFNKCDAVLSPIQDVKIFSGLVEYCKPKIFYLPQPMDIDYFYKKYYNEDREESLFIYDIVHNHTRQGDTIKFSNYLSQKYGVQTIHVQTQNVKKQWEEFLKYWPKCTFHMNLDPLRTCVGQQVIQCATLGVINIGGVNESHMRLFPDTATNNLDVLENQFVKYLENFDARVEVMQKAFDAVNKIYSFNAVKNQFNQIKDIL